MSITCNLSMSNGLTVVLKFSEMDLFILQQEFSNDFEEFKDGGEVYLDFNDIGQYCTALEVYSVYLPDSTEISLVNGHVYVDQKIVHGQFNIEDLFDYSDAYDSYELPILHLIADDLNGNYAKAADIIDSRNYFVHENKRTMVEDLLNDSGVPEYVFMYIDVDSYFDDHVSGLEMTDGRIVSYYD